MFKKLKEKLKKAIKRIKKKTCVEKSEQIEEFSQESQEPEREVLPERKVSREEQNKEQSKESFQGEVQIREIQREQKESNKEEQKTTTIIKKSVKKTEDHAEHKEQQDKEREDKKSIFKKIREKITTTKISEKKFSDIFFELEVALLENNVAYDVIERIKEELKKSIVNKPISRKKVEEAIATALKKAFYSLYSEVENIDLIEMSNKYKPLVILFLGVNGSGKTTTIAKIARMFLDNDKSVVIAASDTFRAAAIEQLEQHAKNLNVKLIKHDYGADPAAVAYDAVAYAKSKAIDVVLIDTAGRLHSNRNLMEELKKIVRVVNPHLKIFVGEAITGNDCIEQAKLFDEHIGIDGIVLTKADVDEKGGAALSIAYVTKKPIIFLGTGQGYHDIVKFCESKIIEDIFAFA